MGRQQILPNNLQISALFLFIISVAHLFSHAEAQYASDFFPLHHAPQGIIHDPLSRCTFVIFRSEIHRLCLNVNLTVNTTSIIATEQSLAGASIVNWAENVTADGYLIFFTRKWTEPTYEIHLCAHFIGSEYWFEPEPTLRVFAKFAGQYLPFTTKRRSKVDFLLDSDRSTFYFLAHPSTNVTLVSFRLFSNGASALETILVMSAHPDNLPQPSFVKMGNTLYWLSRPSGNFRIISHSIGSNETSIIPHIDPPNPSVAHGPTLITPTRIAWIVSNSIYMSVYYLDMGSVSVDQRTGNVLEAYMPSMELGGYMGDLHLAYAAADSRYTVISPDDSQILGLGGFMDVNLLTEPSTDRLPFALGREYWAHNLTMVGTISGLTSKSTIASRPVGSNRVFFAEAVPGGFPSARAGEVTLRMMEMVAPGTIVSLGTGGACVPGQTIISTVRTSPLGTVATSTISGFFHVATVYQTGTTLELYNPSVTTRVDSHRLFEPSGVEGTNVAVVSVSLGRKLQSSLILVYGTTSVIDLPVIIALTPNRRRMIKASETATCLSVLDILGVDVSYDETTAVFVDASEGPITLRYLNISSSGDFVAKRVFFPGPSPSLLAFRLSFNPSNSSEYFFYESSLPLQRFWLGTGASAELLATVNRTDFAAVTAPIAEGFSSSQVESSIFYGCAFNASYPTQLCRASYIYGNGTFLLSAVATFEELNFTASATIASITLRDGSVLLSNYDRVGVNLTQILPGLPTSYLAYRGFHSAALKALWSVGNSTTFIAISRDLSGVDRFHQFERADNMTRSGTVCVSCTSAASYSYCGTLLESNSIVYVQTNGSLATVLSLSLSGSDASAVLMNENSSFVSCKVATSRTIVLLFKSGVVVVNWAPLAGLDTRFLPNYSPFEPLQIETMSTLAGIQVIAEVADRERSYLSPKRLLAVLVLCESDFQCNVGFVCNQRQFCQAPPPPQSVSTETPSVGGQAPSQGASIPMQSNCIGSPPTRSAVCINGVWIINETVTTNTTTGPLVVPGETIIIGSLILGNGSSVRISSGGFLTVEGCVTFGGLLEATVNVPTQSTGPQTIVLINYPNGFCGDVPSRFSNVSITSNPALRSCEKEQSEIIYGPRSLSVVISVVPVEGCNPNASGAQLSTGAIVGIVIGIVAAIALIMGGVWLLRFKLIPAYQVDSKMKDMRSAQEQGL